MTSVSPLSMLVLKLGPNIHQKHGTPSRDIASNVLTSDAGQSIRCAIAASKGLREAEYSMTFADKNCVLTGRCSNQNAFDRIQCRFPQQCIKSVVDRSHDPCASLKGPCTAYRIICADVEGVHPTFQEKLAIPYMPKAVAKKERQTGVVTCRALGESTGTGVARKRIQPRP